KSAAQGTVIFGVCGGFQMLGETLSDPDSVEHGGTINGMELLEGLTVFAKEKTRAQVRGVFQDIEGPFRELSGIPFQGYEIHMGLTQIENNKALTYIESVSGTNQYNKLDGCQQHNVMGSYVHGIFDDHGVSHTMVRSLLKKKGIDIPNLDLVDYRQYKEKQYDLLADAIRASVDMTEIYKILEVGVEEQE
ncbi:MAG TPA: hypothetical protein VLH18_05520, partial [Candidatus Limnocylindrales bacterium]|nr:hypothetical protein [Candidatus Limnocylindrales bacterium]